MKFAPPLIVHAYLNEGTDEPSAGVVKIGGKTVFTKFYDKDGKYTEQQIANKTATQFARALEIVLEPLSHRELQ